MGIIDFFKNDDTVALPDKFQNAVLHPVSNFYYTVNIGHNIVVNEGWTAVIVVKGKPRDVLPAGAHQLSLINLPNTTQVLKLHKGKVKKHGGSVTVELPQSFKCDLYYVNLNPVLDFPWHTGRVSIRSKLYGKYKININGTLNFHITDSAKFVSLMLLEHGHIRSGQGEKVLANLINEEMYDSILFSSFYSPRQFSDKQSINDFLLNKLNENFKHYGIFFDSVNMQNVKFYGKVNEQIMRESEQMPLGYSQNINTDALLGDNVVNFENDIPKTLVQPEQQPNLPNSVYNEEQQEKEREVSERIQVRKKYNNIKEVQEEINQSLTTNSSRIDISEDKPVKIKLNKNTKNED